MELPNFLQIEPVGQCNLRCRMCPIQYRKDGPPYGPPAFISFEKFKRLIDGFPNVSELHLQGLGEPLMHPRFFDMVRYAADKHINVSVNTNLTFLSREKAERCVRSGLNTLHASIDGATATTYEWIRRGADFRKVTSNLNELVRARDGLNSEFPHVRLVMVVMRRNLRELPALVAMAVRWNVESMSVQHLCHDFTEETLPAAYAQMRDFVNEQTLLSEDPALVDSVFEEARAVAAQHDFTLRLPTIRPHPKDFPLGAKRCDWPWRGAYVSYNGDAMPCCMVATPDRINFGNMTEQSPDAVWNNERYSEFRSKLASEDPPAICRACSVYRGVF